jgi:HEAT repeat protein
MLKNEKSSELIKQIIKNLSTPIFIQHYRAELLPLFINYFTSTTDIFIKIDIIEAIFKLDLSKGKDFILKIALSTTNKQLQYATISSYISIEKNKKIKIDNLLKLAQTSNNVNISELIASELLKYNNANCRAHLVSLIINSKTTRRESLPELLVDAFKKRDNTQLSIALIQKIPNATVPQLKNIVRTLAYTNNKISYDALITLLNTHLDKKIRQQVAFSLGDSEYKKAYIPLVHTMLYDKNEDVQDEALEAVANFDIPKIIQELKRIKAIDNDSEVQKNIKVALKELL